jgi:hypothetical protein
LHCATLLPRQRRQPAHPGPGIWQCKLRRQGGMPARNLSRAAACAGRSGSASRRARAFVARGAMGDAL